MKAKLRNGFVINGRLADIFVSRGIAVEINETEGVDVTKIDVTKETSKKRTRRTKAEIEADKNKK